MQSNKVLLLLERSGLHPNYSKVSPNTQYTYKYNPPRVVLYLCIFLKFGEFLL